MTPLYLRWRAWMQHMALFCAVEWQKIQLKRWAS